MRITTQTEAKRLFGYDPRGLLTWRVDIYRRNQIGKRAGGRRGVYEYIKYDGHDHLAHRLIFLWHHGWLPEQVDHEDRDKTNNRIDNLRPSNYVHNGNNRGATIRSKTGSKGIYPTKSGRFAAHLTVEGHQIFLRGV